MPAVSAASLPKLRDRNTHLTGKFSRSPTSVAALSSVLPSSTTTISNRSVSVASVSANCGISRRKLADSLQAGMTQEIEGASTSGETLADSSARTESTADDGCGSGLTVMMLQNKIGA